MEKEGYYYLKTKVHSYQLDRDKQISAVAIAELMQEAAGMHSNTGGFGYKQVISKSLVWVLNAMRFEVNKFPVWDDEITIKTWIVDTNRFLSRRDFQFVNAAGEVLISGSTIWILYNFETKRPQNILAMDFDVMEHNGEFAVENAIKTTRENVEGELVDAFTVKYSDLDMVGHLNNTRYVRAIIDSYDISHFEDNILKSFEIQFRAEAKYGEILKIFEEKNDDLSSKLEIKRGDDKSVCLSKIEWGKENI
jgi:acyl-ACP thioesterase